MKGAREHCLPGFGALRSRHATRGPRRKARRRRHARPLGALALILALSAPAAAGAPRPSVSLPAIERRVMCVTCKIPLNVAESAQADRERALIRSLIARGDTDAQIERALVSQYGPGALALPRASGFDLSAYLAPLAAMLALAATLTLLLWRWRRYAKRQAAQPAPQDASPTLTAAERARLDADLAQFER